LHFFSQSHNNEDHREEETLLFKQIECMNTLNVSGVKKKKKNKKKKKKPINPKGLKSLSWFIMP